LAKSNEDNLKGVTALATAIAGSPPHKGHVALPLLIMGLIYWLSSLPGTPLPNDPAVYALFYWLSPTIQNILHVPAFASLTWAWCWALAGWLNGARVRAISAAGVAFGYGVLDEWHQSFVPGRHASLADVLLDSAGVVIGIGVAAWAARCAGSVPAAEGGARTRLP